jgi:DNA-binding response OmpR family regulator
MKISGAIAPKLTALVVEDDDDVRLFLRVLLSKSGIDVHAAANGREGLETAVHIKPDIILLDLAMPEVDGFGFLTHRRTLREIADTPVIVLTARHQSQDVRRAIDLGAVDYVAKPFDNIQLLRRIVRHANAGGALKPASTRVSWS